MALESGVFATLRPLCTAIMECVSLEVQSSSTRTTRDAMARAKPLVDSLADLIVSLPPRGLAKCAGYTLMPLECIEGGGGGGFGTACRESAMRCTARLVERCGVFIVDPDPSTFVSVLQRAVAVLDSNHPAPAPAPAPASEELKLEAVHCLGSLFCSGSRRREKEALECGPQWEQLLSALSSPGMRACVGHCCSVLLAVAKEERQRQLRVAAIETVGHMLRCLPSADTWRCFYPGIVTAMFKITMADRKQGTTVVLVALRVFFFVTDLVLDDGVNDDVLPAATKEASSVAETLDILRRRAARFTTGAEAADDESELLPEATPPPPPREEGGQPQATTRTLEVALSREWQVQSADRLTILLPHVITMCGQHESWRVRCEMANGVASLLSRCNRSLRDAVPNMVDGLLSLLWDVMPRASAAAKRALATVRQNVAPPQWTAVRRTVETRLVERVLELPLLASACSGEARCRLCLQLIAGYLELLQERTRVVADIELRRLVVALCDSLRFDVDSIHALETRNDGGGCVVSCYRKSFAHFRESDTIGAVRRVLRLLGRHCNLSALTDELLGIIHSEPPTAFAEKNDAGGGDRGSIKPAALSRRDRSGLSREELQRKRRNWLQRQLGAAFVLNESLLGAAGFIVEQEAALATTPPAERTPQVAGSDDGSDKEGDGDGDELGVCGEFVRPEDGDGFFPELAPQQMLSFATVIVEDIIHCAAWVLPTNSGSPQSRDETGDGDFTATSDIHAGAFSRRGEHLQRSSSTLPAGDISAQTLNANAQLIALLLECVGNLARVCSTHFGRGPLLIRCLYPVLEKLADHHPVVRQSALSTLQRVAFYTSGGDGADVRMLLAENMDYLVDALCGRLRALDQFPRTPAVVSALLKHSGASTALPLLRDVAASVLSDIDAEWQGRHGVQLVHTMLEMLRSMREPPQTPAAAAEGSASSSEPHGAPKPRQQGWVQSLVAEFTRGSADDGDDGDDDCESKPEDARAFFTGRMADERASVSDRPQAEDPSAAMPIEGGTDNDAAQEDGSGVPSSGEERLVLDILSRCEYFIASPDLPLQHVVVGIICEGLQLLHDSRDALLPTVHKLWSPIMQRMRDVDPCRNESIPLLLRLLELVSVLGRLCGDFISARFAKELWPLFCKMLKAHPPHLQAAMADSQTYSAAAAEAVERARVRYEGVSLVRRLQSSLMRCLRDLCGPETTCKQLIRPLVLDIGITCRPFLANNVALPLREEAMALYRRLVQVDSDVLWSTLMRSAGWDLPPPLKIQGHRLQGPRLSDLKVAFANMESLRQRVPIAASSHSVAARAILASSDL